MKKCLLLASSVVLLLSANAQDRSKSVYRDASHMTKIDQESTSIIVKGNNVPNDKAASTILLGTSFNVFGILGDRQNQVVYNKDINTVAFVHRQNDGGPGGTNASGIMSFDYSTDGGATWTINPFQVTPGLGGGNGNRYPNIALYNPPANTDPADAYVVMSGPQLETGAFSGENGWGGTFRASAKFDASNIDEQYFHLSTDSDGDNNEWGAAGMYNANGVIWDVTTNIDNRTNSNVPADNYSTYFINKGVYNSGTNVIDWTNTSFSPTWVTTLNDATASQTNLAGLPNMAWSPDGMTGYIVAMGAWGANTMYRPYVMKTVDGGTTWNNVNDYDFSTNPVLQQYIFGLNTNPAIQRPFFGSFDMVVGQDDELRIFGEVGSGWSDHADSLNFTFGARQAGFLFEVATNGANWDVTFIDSIFVDDHEWDATNTLSHFVRPQASRSQDGSKVFYTWLGSNSLLSLEREFPDVWAIGHDIAGTEPMPWSIYKNLSFGTPASFVSAYQTVAVDAIENGTDHNWELAIAYGTGNGGSPISDGLSAPQWNYLKGVGFSVVDFSAIGGGSTGGVGSGGNLGGSVSVDEQVITNENIALFPNPSNGLITLQISNTKNFNYTIVDVVGNTIKSENVNGNSTVINLTNNAKGIYFVNINNGSNTITKKVILTK